MPGERPHILVNAIVAVERKVCRVNVPPVLGIRIIAERGSIVAMGFIDVAEHGCHRNGLTLGRDIIGPSVRVSRHRLWDDGGPCRCAALLRLGHSRKWLSTKRDKGAISASAAKNKRRLASLFRRRDDCCWSVDRPCLWATSFSHHRSCLGDGGGRAPWEGAFLIGGVIVLAFAFGGASCEDAVDD